jgi:hypothetical protein
MCEFFDTAAPQQCREPVADLVSDKARANFCGYFRINPHAFTASADQADASRRQLDALFGHESSGVEPGADSAGSPQHEKLEDLFKK